jgi:hypothetical protein
MRYIYIYDMHYHVCTIQYMWPHKHIIYIKHYTHIIIINMAYVIKTYIIKH